MSFSIAANLIRQWCYCPRIVYYRELLNLPTRYPLWVEQGTRFHDKLELLWKRRRLSRFGLSEGVLHMQLAGQSERVNVYGIADMVIESVDSVYPVEFKLSAGQPNRASMLQLTAYGLIAEECFSKRCPMGFLTDDKEHVICIEFNNGLIGQLERVIGEMKIMFENGCKPDSSASLVQCANCEYYNHCNDRE